MWETVSGISDPDSSNSGSLVILIGEEMKSEKNIEDKIIHYVDLGVFSQ